MVKCLLETKDWENITRERKHCESVYENCVHYVCVERKRESIVRLYILRNTEEKIKVFILKNVYDKADRRTRKERCICRECRNEW